MKVKFFSGFLDGQILDLESPLPPWYKGTKPSGREEFYDLRTVFYATKPIGEIYVLRGITDYQLKQIMDRYVPV